MKIIFIASDNNIFSGAFLSMAKLAEILIKEYNHEIMVILPCRGEGEKLLDKYGVNSKIIRSYPWIVKVDEKDRPIVKVKCLVKRCVNFVAIQRISRLIIEESADIVHINTLWTYVGALAALKTKVPFIWHVREFLEEDQGVQIWDREKGYELLKKSTHAIAISSGIYDKYAPIIGEKKVSIVSNGIEPDRFLANEHRLFEKSPYEILIVGNIRKEKGQITAIKACMKLHEDREEKFRLKILGSGNDAYVAQLKHYVQERHASQYILFCGETDKPEVFFQAADITLMCSEAEAFGRVTVEAMMAGSLVIASDSAGSRDIIEHKKTGLTFTNRDIDDLERQLAYSFSHIEEMRKIAGEGTAYALNRFTADRNASEVNGVYKKVIEGDDTMERSKCILSGGGK